MTTEQITPSQIFEAKQILTLDIANELIGKKIATTSPEYKANREDVRIGRILSIESEWDLAAKQDHSHLDGGKWDTSQDYWKYYMSENQIKNQQSRLKLVTDSNLYGTYSEFDGFFFGSDSDRPIFYIVIDEN